MSFIEFKNITKKYKGNDKNSVTDFTLDVDEKEFIADCRNFAEEDNEEFNIDY